MRLNVTVPVSEINAELRHLLIEMLLLLVVILVVFAMLTSQLARHITKPLEDLTEAAEQVDSGNYDVKLDYKGHDEVGILTRTFSQLISHLKIYISDLNSLAYADALTSVRNKGAFDIYVKKLQAELDDYSGNHEFAIAFFDCDDLKEINDKYGHDKGNLYLKNTCKLICEVFRHSPVFRLGGDEFAAIMQNEDYRDKLELMRQFEQKSADTCVMNKDPWDQVRAAMGIAVYDSRIDVSAEDVVRRADKLMYDNKREHKKS
jgi:diguanylate cyclase (GGDEF)-like protein